MTSVAIFDSSFVDGKAIFDVSFKDPSIPLTLVTDIDLGNVSSSLSSIDNPSSSSPQVNISTRFNGVRHWHFAIEGGEGKTPHIVINRSRLEASNFLSTNIPCYTTDFVNWIDVTNVQWIGSYSGTIEFDTSALPAGTVYFANAPLGRYIDSTLFIADMLTNHSDIASPTSSADVNGVYYTSPAETDDLGRAVGGNPQRAIRLSWGGATTDGLRKRKMVVLTQIHSAGESQSWTTFLDSIDWMMNSVGAEAVAFRSNFEVYIYCPVTPNGLRSGTMRMNPSRATDPNRDWYLTSSSALLEISALRTAIEADTDGSCDIFFSWHGFWVYSQNYIIGGTPDDMNVSTRAPVAHEMITYGTTLFGASPNLQTSGTNNTDCWWGYAKLGAKASFDVEIHGAGNTDRSNYTTIATNWMLMVHHVDAAGLLVTAAELVGDASVLAVSSGQLTTEIPLLAAAVNISTASASITTSINLSGVSASVATAGGAIDTQIALSGSAVAQALAGAGVDTQIFLSGLASVQATATGDLSGAAQLSGDAAVSAQASGDLSTQIPLSGESSTQATASGALDTEIHLSGSATSQATASGDLSGAAALQGSAQGQATASATLTAQITLSGAAIAQALATGALDDMAAELSGQATGQASASGALSSGIALGGDANAVVTGAGDLSTGISLQGVAISQATATGDIAISFTLEGNAIALVLAGGTLTTQIPLLASAQSVASVTGDLTGLPIDAPAGAGYVAARVTGISRQTQQASNRLTQQSRNRPTYH